MRAAWTAAVCLSLAGIALAGPTFRIGTKLTWRGAAGSSGIGYDVPGERVVMVNYDGAFVGATAEVVYGPVWRVLSGRIDIFQIRVIPDDALLMIHLLPMLGLDVMAEPPVNWRMRPYVWAGARAPDHVETNHRPLRYEFGTHWCGGLGARYTLTERIELFAETQLYSNDIWRHGVSAFHQGSLSGRLTGTETTGLLAAELGARFALGK